eukprot:TRINITY_DN3168_c4_g1_i2.p1 TRINITY_DN3168_c4_g1~~TRINITY_DN3168_c4_g1_i2.p1  ORF type:complete len:590 (+),score=95.66 TRINITY_DN3168_c4_g1_i2:50-1771(+)
MDIPIVLLEVKLPHESVMVNAEATESLQRMKDNVAELCKLYKNTFILTFDGEEVGGVNDGRLVRDVPFEDCSTLQVVLHKEFEARVQLTEMGYPADLINMWECLKLPAYNRRHDEGRQEILYLALIAGLCKDKEKVGHVLYRAVSDPTCLAVCVEFLLVNTDVDVNHINCHTRQSCSLLHGAAISGHGEVVNILLQHGADDAAKNDEGRTPLFFALGLHGRRGSVAAVEALLQHNADANIKDNKGCTPLHTYLSGFSGNTALVQLLLQYGADVNSRDKCGRTALQKLVSNSADETEEQRSEVLTCMSLLLQHGASVNLVDTQGDTLLHTMLQAGADYLAQILLENGHVAQDSVLLRNNDGFTPLHTAVSGSVEMATVLLLLHHGADVSATDGLGCRPFHRLVQTTNRNLNEVAPLLLEDDGDVNARDNNGKAPLHSAVLVSEKTVLFLLQHNADVDARDNEGRTPLHEVARESTRMGDTTATVCALLGHGADIQARDNEGKTALHAAVASRHPSAARTLVQRGADVKARDNKEKTPLHLSTDVSSSQLLMEHKAERDARDGKGVPKFDGEKGG